MIDHYGEIARYYDMIYGADIDYKRESQGLHQIFKNGSVKRILDIACGSAAHLIHLGRLGYEGTGIDISQRMLDIGRKKAETEGLSINLVSGDMNHLQGLDLGERFDAVISLYAPGLNASPAGVKHTLHSIRPLLKVDGLLVLNLMNARCGFLDTSSPELSFDACDVDGVKVVWFYQTVLKGKEQHLTAVYLVEDKGEPAMYVHHHLITSFALDEAKKLLEGCGFQTSSVYGSLVGLTEFQGEEPAMWLVAHKK